MPGQTERYVGTVARAERHLRRSSGAVACNPQAQGLAGVAGVDAEAGMQFAASGETHSPAGRASSTVGENGGRHVDAKTYPLQDILKPERRYIIPTFQRDYEWTLDGQWRLLFDDLASTADRLLDVRTTVDAGTKLKAKEQAVSPHFLGAIVCASLPFATGGVALRSVIDGQQRLTTVQLLIRGLLDVLVENESERTKSVRRMLFNPEDVVESPDEMHKLWPRRKDRDVWPVAMADKVPKYGDGDHLYLQARGFFSRAVRTYASDDHSNVEGDYLVALADSVSSLFKLVVIDLEENDDAQVIFEVLNGRQTPLSAIDLVKNLLFLRGEFEEEDVETLYDTYWAQFDDRWWKQTVGRGHAARGHRDVLLSAWLTAATGEEANVGHLYREARNYLDEGPSTEDVLVELNTFAAAYQTVYAELPIEDERLAAVYGRIRALDITTAIPLLVWLGTLSPSELTLDSHVRAARAVESWAVRRAYVGWQTRGYGAHFARVLKQGKSALKAGGNVTAAVVKSLQDGRLDWPTDEEVHDAFQHRRFYSVISQSRIRLLLGALDHQLRCENPHEPAAVVEYDNLQIEHIMPRSWKVHWPIISTGGTLIPTDDDDPIWVKYRNERSGTVDRIGNLTLVTGTFNRGVSNLKWDVKQPEFAKQKSLVLNYDVAKSDTWDEPHIRARAHSLAEAAVRLWPSPETLLSPID